MRRMRSGEDKDDRNKALIEGIHGDDVVMITDKYTDDHRQIHYLYWPQLCSISLNCQPHDSIPVVTCLCVVPETAVPHKTDLPLCPRCGSICSHPPR